MAVLRCKMCGGTLELNNNESVAICSYCGMIQTLPKINNEKIERLYDRANYFRRNNEFDKALTLYEEILNEDNTDAETYWSLVLCRYGIEYVEETATHKKVATINRVQYTSILQDEDYQTALKYADSEQRKLYEAEANYIAELQKSYLDISKNEKPFDIFICYKETDAQGNRTQDSVYAQNLYKLLTQEGYKVFFSRVTLEDKLGTKFEPYIFAALHSSKVMLVLGTNKENFDAVWVKNEWSRYLSLIKNGESKTIIPIYKDMSPYDLPEELAYLQAQDMEKIGFEQDLLRGIAKLISPEELAKEKKADTTGIIVETMLSRGQEFLLKKEWNKAKQYFENVLDYDAQNVEAYLGKLLIDCRVSTLEELQKLDVSFVLNENYNKIVQLDAGEIIKKLDQCEEKVQENIEIKKLSIKKKGRKIIKILAIVSIIGILSGSAYYVFENTILPVINYKKACSYYENKSYAQAIEIFNANISYKDSEEMLEKCRYGWILQLMEEKKYEEAINELSLSDFSDKEELTNECNYQRAKLYIEQSKELSTAIDLLNNISGYKDTDNLLKEAKYKKAIEELKGGQYKKAVESFTAIENDFDVSEEILEAMYLHCVETADSPTGVTRRYIKELLQAGYRDSEQIAEQIYQWKAEIDSVKAILNKNTSSYNGIKILINLTGGRPDKKIKVYFKVSVSDGRTGEFSDEKFYNAGDKVTCVCTWDNGDVWGKTFDVKIYDQNNNLIGTFSELKAMI